MLRSMGRWLAAAVAAALLAGCGSTPKSASLGWPDWALNPPQSEEFSAGDCVAASHSVSLDRAQAAARARTLLAQQIEVRVEAVDQAYQSRVAQGKAPKLESSFASTSKQTVNLALQGARIARAEAVSSRSGELFCVLVAMERQTSGKLPADVIRSSGAALDADSEAQLIARFQQTARSRAGAAGARP